MTRFIFVPQLYKIWSLSESSKERFDMEAQRKKVLGKEMPQNDELLKLEKESLEKERKELVEQIVSYQKR